METIRPGVVIDGETFYPEGWMYILAFALKGIPWAVTEALKPEFEQTWLKQMKTEEEKALYQKQLKELRK